MWDPHGEVKGTANHLTELLDFSGQGAYSPDYHAPQPDARLRSAGQTERNGGSRRSSCLGRRVTSFSCLPLEETPSETPPEAAAGGVSFLLTAPAPPPCDPENPVTRLWRAPRFSYVVPPAPLPCDPENPVTRLWRAPRSSRGQRRSERSLARGLGSGEPAAALTADRGELGRPDDAPEAVGERAQKAAAQ